MGGSVRQPSETDSESDSTADDRAEGPVFVISTNDLCHVLGNTEAHYVSQLFAANFETHVFAPLASDLPNAENHRYPFGGALGVFALNFLFLPYWLYVGLRLRPKVVYAYNNVILPPLVVRAVSGAAVVHDLQCDPHDQMREFAENDGGPSVMAPLLWAVKLGHRFALPRSDAVITLSENLRQRLHRNYGVPLENVHVVPLGVDTEVFTPDAGSDSREEVREPTDSRDRGPADRENREPTDSEPLDADTQYIRDAVKEDLTDRVRIAYLGTIKQIRGLETVVEGLARLDDEHRQRVRFDVYGSGDEEFLAALRETADARGVEMVYHGHVGHEEVPAALAACDLAVSPLPPLDAYQVSCPAKIFEYLATGLPVVATRIAPHEQHLTHGRNAILVEPRDADAFADAFARFLDDPETLRTASANARETALDQDWTERFRRITAVVAAAQERRRGGGFRASDDPPTDRRPISERPAEASSTKAAPEETGDRARRNR